MINRTKAMTMEWANQTIEKIELESTNYNHNRLVFPPDEAYIYFLFFLFSLRSTFIRTHKVLRQLNIRLHSMRISLVPAA